MHFNKYYIFVVVTFFNKTKSLFIGNIEDFQMNSILNNLDYTNKNCLILSFVHNNPGTVIATLKSSFKKNTYDYNVITYSKGDWWWSIQINLKNYFSECQNVYKINIYLILLESLLF